MNFYFYILFFLPIFLSALSYPIEKEIMTLEEAIFSIDLLAHLQQERPALFADDAMAKILQDLDFFVYGNRQSLQPEVYEEMAKKIAEFWQLNMLYQKRAPRLDAPNVAKPQLVDQQSIWLRDEYLRNLIVTGSLIAPHLNSSGTPSGLYVLKAGDTMTGDLTLAGQHGIVFDDSSSGSVFIQAPGTISSSYTLQLPVNSGNAGQVLASNGSNPDQLYWTDITAIVTSTIQLYGDVTGSSTANKIQTICGVSACTLVGTVTSGTPADIPNTLVKRDSSGGFAATNVTTTGYTIFTNSTGTQSVSLTAGALAATYTLVLPTTQATGPNQALFNNGSGQLSWGTIATPTIGIQSINTATASAQYLATNTGGTNLGFFSTTNGNTLVLPYAGNVSGANVGLITGADWQNFETAYNAVTAATSVDVPNTLVLRDSSGGFAATNVTTTGYTIFTNSTGTQSVSLTAGALAATYTLVLPTTQATGPNQALFNNGSGQLSWGTIATPTIGIQSINTATASAQYLATNTGGTNLGFFSTTNGNTLVLPYAGNVSGANVGLITGADWQNFETAYNAVTAATSVDVPNTLVKRDATGSFVATTITLTGCLQLLDLTSGLAGTICTTTSALIIAPQSTRALQATSTGNIRGQNSIDLQMVINQNTQVASGNNAVIAGGAYNTASGNYSLVGAGVHNIAFGNASFIGSGGIGSSSFFGNVAGGQSSAVVAGDANIAANDQTFIGSGYSNYVGGNSSAIVTGSNNSISGFNCFIGGGAFNTVGGNYAAVLAGQHNNASGLNSVALGQNAAATQDNSFVWADGQGSIFSSSSINTFNIRALNGFVMQGDSNGNITLTVPSGLSTAYTLTLPINSGSAGQFLTTSGGSSAQLSWISPTFLVTATSADVPLTLVLRDNSGSFSATNVTTTGYQILTSSSGTESVSITGGSLAATYTLVLPTTQATGPNQALFNDGSGQLSWVTTLTGGIESLNGATAPAQYLATNTGGTNLGFFSTINGNTLVLPYAANVTGGNVGLITGADWQNFENTYSTVSAATAQDVPSTLVLRDGSGSFAATNVTTRSFAATNVTTTGYQVFVSPNGLTTVSLTAGSLSATYTLVLPTTQATGPNQALFNNGVGQLSWVTTLTGGIESLNGATAPAQYLVTNTGGTNLGFFSTTNGNTLVLPYVGNVSGANVGLITGADWQHFQTAYTTIVSATSVDVPLTLVERDNTGSFAATTITLTGNSMINYSTSGGYLWAPTNQNTLIGLGVHSPATITGLNNVALGYQAFQQNTTGAQNIAIGAQALQLNTTGSQNIGIGYQALQNNVSAGYNTAIGYLSMQQNPGSFNTAVGATAMQRNEGGSQNTAVGYSALINTIGTANTAVGYQAMPAFTVTGGFNNVIGTGAAALLTTGSYNNIFGYNAGIRIASGLGNNIMGNSAGNNITGSSNIVIGDSAGANITTANNVITIGASLAGINRSNTTYIANIYGTSPGSIDAIPIYVDVNGCLGTIGNNSDTLLGYEALAYQPINQLNTAIGYFALANNTTGIQNTAIGANAAKINMTGSNNTCLGFEAGFSLTSGSDNTLLGSLAGDNITTGSANTVVGYSSLVWYPMTGGYNSVFGAYSAALLSTGSYNNIVGYNSGNALASGNNNNIIGSSAGANLTGSNNIIIGDNAGTNITSANNVTVIGASIAGVNTSNSTYIGSISGVTTSVTNGRVVYVDSNDNLGTVLNNNDTILGDLAMAAITTGINGENTAIGAEALSACSSGPTATQNTAVGYGALGALSVGSSQNTCVGATAAPLLQLGSGNTFVGAAIGSAMASGDNNTFIGYAAGINSTANNNIIIGALAGGGVKTASNVIAIGIGGSDISSTTYIANIYGVTTSGSSAVFCSNTGQLGTVSSSKRYKDNIMDIGTFSEKIYQLRPVQFTYKIDAEKWFEAGLIAEEVHDKIPEIVVCKDGQPETVRYQHLPILMLNEQQKDHKILLELKEENARLKQAVESLMQRLTALENIIS